MKIVFAKHDIDSKEYIFEVPDGMNIKKGDILFVDTMRGQQIAVATTDMQSGEYTEHMLSKLGAYLPLKKVLAYANKEIQDYIFNNTINGIISTIEHEKQDSYLPF